MSLTYFSSKIVTDLIFLLNQNVTGLHFRAEM